ncbi:tetratricopeptide repeat protein 8-like [Tetranychus urticae]|uniref:tetratricopeptide repeat protein 8-like n=1 Tax=Tetranychus urticae TaxID=32264 RepID=UPI00077BCA24|nr:tetratricopeptide repeat protein 8-like [Tetranychus urticae]XP_015792510.1 tetratricopeptide repeat protein 8-like [Tetranychus urticae]
MDPLYLALSLHRRRKFDECIKICTQELEKTPLDQAFWLLKMRSLTSQVFVDDVEADEEGIAELLMDDNAISSVPRPGTSLRVPSANQSIGRDSPNGSSNNPLITSSTPFTGNRPITQSGRPITGMLRPGTQSSASKIGSMENTLKTPRTSRTARPMTSASGRFVRLGTASMLSGSSGSYDDGPFINLARLNIAKYATLPVLSKSLFEYILYKEGDVRHALDLAAQGSQHSTFNDWYWKLGLGKCYYKMGLLRDAETQFRSASKHNESTVDVYLWLGKVYLRLDQPLAALNIYKTGLTKFPSETFLLAYCARVHEALSQLEESVTIYKEILSYEATNVEAIACIAMHHFYCDQPEIGLRYYRHLLQMGTKNAQIYNNLGLCCYYSQQFDMAITCFEKALNAAQEDDLVADIWYNIGMIAIGSGDKQLASQAFRLALVADNTHPEAYNNLGVLEMTKTNPTTHNLHQAKAFFQASATASETNGCPIYEPHYNLSLIGEKTGHYDLSYQSVKKALSIYPNFYAAKAIYERIKKEYENV